MSKQFFRIEYLQTIMFYLHPTGKSALSLWKSITFYPNNVLKSVNKLYFGQNNKKVDKFFYLFTLQIWENIKAKFP